MVGRSGGKRLFTLGRWNEEIVSCTASGAHHYDSLSDENSSQKSVLTSTVAITYLIWLYILHIVGC